MNREVVFAAAGFVGGVLIALAIFAFATDNSEMGEGSMSMDDMLNSLEGKRDAEFDMAFIDAMIVHHEGAIMMAKMVNSSTSRPELLNLAKEIITLQEGEIMMMKDWKEDWSR